MKFKNSTAFVLLVMVISTIVIQKVISYQFNMHYTDEFSGEIQYHCLRYTVLDDINTDESIPFVAQQSILYCFRLIQYIDFKHKNRKTLISNDNENVFSNLTFEQLKM